GGVGGGDVEDLDGVAGESPGTLTPLLEGGVPGVVVVVNTGGADDDDVDVACGVGVAPGEGAEHDDAERDGRDVGGGAGEFGENGEDPSLGAGDQRLHRCGEIHPATLPLIYGTTVPSMRGRGPPLPGLVGRR